MFNNKNIPTYLKNFAKDIEANDFTLITINSSTGNEKLEIWYYGELFSIQNETQLYIGNTDTAPEKIVAKDPLTGEEIVLFDGAKHGYDNMFCEEYEADSINNRPLIKYDIPPSRLIVQLGYSIPYDEEKEYYEVDENNNVQLIDGSTISWEDLKRNGFDFISISFVDEKGKAIQFFDRELA